MAKKSSKSAVAYSYVRFSSPEQAKGDSLRRQVDLRDRWLATHGIALDTSLTLRDEGISGFSGKHRENPDRHALATFLEFVHAGRIARGSYLIVESLDRLTREHIRPALTLLLNLIDNGIRIVQLLPVETIYDENVEPMTLMMAIMELSRGHSESRMKSERLGRAWCAKRERASSQREVLTKRIPGWLTVRNGILAIDEARASVVRRIFTMASGGYGLGQITKALNAEQVPPIGRASYWARSYVAKILATRTVLGEFQPHRMANRQKRTPEGDLILDYYPAILSEAEWYAARAALTDRRSKPGRLGKGAINLFANLLRDARDGGTLIQINKGKKSGGKLLASYRAHQGLEGAKMVTFPFDPFERAILSQLREIAIDDVLPKSPKSSHAVLQLAGRLATIDERLAKISAAILDNGDIAALATAAKKLEHEKAGVIKDLDAARMEASNPLSETWTTCQSLIDLIDTAKDQRDVRTRLRGAIRRVVDSLWCLFHSSGSKRIAFVQVWFHGQSSHRDYVIVHHPAHFGFDGQRDPKRTEAKTVVRSMRYRGPVDLRDREAAKIVERYVEEVFKTCL